MAKSASAKQQQDLLDRGLTMRPMASVGRSLVALKLFPAGEQILHDQPVVRWAGDAALPAALAELRLGGKCEGSKYLIPQFLACAALAFLSLNPENKDFEEEDEIGRFTPRQRRAIVLDMHIPELPIGHRSTIELYDFSHRLSNSVIHALEAIPTSQWEPQLQKWVAAEGDVDSQQSLVDDVIDVAFAASHNGFAREKEYAHAPRHVDPTSSAVEGHTQALESLRAHVQSVLLHAMFAAKVNSHRTSSGHWCLFPLGSKFAHSCDPNVMYVLERQAFVAVKTIVPGEHLHFNYAGGRTFLQSTHLRQKGLLSSHLFLCRCARCDGPDLARQIICPACKQSHERPESEKEEQEEELPELGYVVRRGSPLQLLDEDVFPEKLWHCTLHPDSHNFTDAELTGESNGKLLIREKQFEAAVLALINGKYQYKPMKVLCVAIGETLGRRHWTYASLCQHFTLYFREMVRSGCAAARHLAFGWGMRFLECLEVQGFISRPTVTDHRPPFPHMIAAAHITTMAQVCAVVTRYHKPLTQLCYVILPLVLSLYPSSDSRVQQVQGLAYHVNAPPSKNPGQHTGAPTAGGNEGTSPISEDAATSETGSESGNLPSEPPTSLHQVLQRVGPTAVAKVRAQKKAECDGRQKKQTSVSLTDGDPDFDESTLFSLWDRFVVLMVLKQQVSNNSTIADGSSSVGLSSATGSADSLDSYASFE